MPDSAEDLAAVFAQPCNYCRQMIMWGNTAAGERMPVDADPTPFGNVRLHRRGRVLTADVIGKAEDRRRLRLGGHPLFQHHRLSCTKAEQWARTQAKPTPAVDTPRPVGGLW
jgi:hypothetical protein